MNRTVRNVFESLYDFLCQIFTLVFALVGKLGGTAASSTMMAALSSRSSLRFEGSGITVTYSSDSLLGSDSVLGEGAFSTVFTAKDVFSDKQYAGSLVRRLVGRVVDLRAALLFLSDLLYYRLI